MDVWSRGLLRLVSSLGAGELHVILPNGHAATFTAPRVLGPRGILRIKRRRAIRRLLTGGDVAFAEAYMDGDWDTPDLTALIELAAVNQAAGDIRIEAPALRRVVDRIRHLRRRNTRAGSRRNIAHHYDLSNAFYRLWLDEGMSYSSALFASEEQPLVEGQAAKNRRLADLLGLTPGLRLLEIGCGWGAFALMAARDYGCRVTAITLSRAQHRYTRARIRDAGLDDLIDVRLQDYRDVDGRYDRIASTEMFEAIGERYWPRFFDVLQARLEPGGIAALQIITVDQRRFEAYRRRPDFIQKYIFPGGMLPSPPAFRREAAAKGFAVNDAFMFGRSYARTLALWQSRFQQAWPRIEALGFDGRFKRTWEYYLAYCEAGFRAGSIDVGQFRLVRA
ncbi:MAG: class I SAM-dependent methyltransferase [Rhodospirillales bacterium]|nr:class I SAM-dependent methyltransferase [Rhodospirillales bacterium]